MQKIAGDLTINDWNELDNKLDNIGDAFWSGAYEFFQKRMDTRFFNPINSIIDRKVYKGEGFAIVNLQCSLIETIESFHMGWIYNYPHFNSVDGSPPFKGNQKIFESFFAKRDPFKSLNIDGNAFYHSVRNGLLHETQTKNGWLIKAKSSKIYEDNGVNKIIYRNNFQAALEDVVRNYKSQLLCSSAISETLRANFRAKFNHICIKSN